MRVSVEASKNETFILSSSGSETTTFKVGLRETLSVLFAGFGFVGISGGLLTNNSKVLKFQIEDFFSESESYATAYQKYFVSYERSAQITDAVPPSGTLKSVPIKLSSDAL